MYIIAIGWIWVVFMMSITESSIVAGLITFVFYGVVPCGLLMYLLGTPARWRRQARARAMPPPDEPVTPPEVPAKTGQP